MTIKRYFSDDNLKRIKKDFDFLVEIICKSSGEFDFAIRDNYFNIYYKGNSLAKVEPKENKESVDLEKAEELMLDTIMPCAEGWAEEKKRVNGMLNK